MKRILIIIIVINNTILNIFSMDFFKYSDYLKSKFTSYKWDYAIQSAYSDIKENKYYSAQNNFLKAIDKGCKSPEIYQDTLKCYLIHNDLKDGIDWVESKWDVNLKKQGYKLIANKYFEKKDYINSLNYYLKSDLSSDKYEYLADEIFKLNDFENANLFYGYANLTTEKINYLANFFFNQNRYDIALIYFKKNNDLNSAKLCLEELVENSIINEHYNDAAHFYVELGLTKKEACNKIGDLLSSDADKKVKNVESANDEINYNNIIIIGEVLSKYMTALNFYNDAENIAKVKIYNNKIKSLKEKYKNFIKEQ